MIIVQEIWAFENANPTAYCYPCDSLETAKEVVKKFKHQVNELEDFLGGVFYHKANGNDPHIIKREDEEYIFQLKDTKSNTFYSLVIGDDDIVTMDNIDLV